MQYGVCDEHDPEDMASNKGLPRLFCETFLPQLTDVALLAPELQGFFIWLSDISNCYEHYHCDEFTTLMQGFSVDGVDFMHEKCAFGNGISVNQCNFVNSNRFSRSHHPLRLFA